jgi:hypothetical protein
VRLRISTAAALCTLAVSAAAQTPVVTTLDAAGDVGSWNAVALRPDGRGFVAYADTTNAALKVASCDDRACTSAALATIDTGGPFAHVSVAIGPADRPVVAYHHQPTDALRLALCADAACSSAVVVPIEDAADLNEGTDVAIGADGLPFVVYTDASTSPTVLKTAHCDDAGCATRTVTVHADSFFAGDAVVAIGADGLPVFASRQGVDIRVGHCVNRACTGATFTRLVGFSSASFQRIYSDPSLALGGDGRMVLAYSFGEQGSAIPPFYSVQLHRCADVACGALVGPASVAWFHTSPDLAMAPGDRPLVTHYGAWTTPDTRLKLTRCSTPSCPAGSPFVAIDAPDTGLRHALAADAVGAALLSYYDAATDDLKVAWVGTPPEIAVADLALDEGQAGPTLAHVPVTLSGADAATVDFTTGDGTATAGTDYLATSGTLTFTPGTSTQFVTVSVVGDATPEPDETFRVLLSNAQGAPIVDGVGIVTIRNDDALPRLSVSDASTLEGNAGFFTMHFLVSLDVPPLSPVLVDFATADLTATAGVDYVPRSGILTFAPGSLTAGVTVSSIADLQVEPDELFRLLLSNPQGAVIEDGEGLGTLLNDDELPILGELRHGASYQGDLASDGLAADADVFPLLQDPLASYEVVVDAVSGDARPLTLERRDSGGGVLQSGAGVGTGSAVALRWIVSATTAVPDETVRIAGVCGTACGPDDVYRVRAYETTLRAARFNNTGGQTTVLVLSNPRDVPVALAVRFWGPDGTLLATHTPAAPLAPHAVLVLNTAGVVPGASGSLTLAHDAPYGGVAGKAVALEPSTGFSFDTPLEPRPR